MRCLAADLFAANSTAPVEELSPVDAVPAAYIQIVGDYSKYDTVATRDNLSAVDDGGTVDQPVVYFNYFLVSDEIASSPVLLAI